MSSLRFRHLSVWYRKMKQSKWVLMTQNVFYHDFASSPPIKIDALAPWHMINHALKFKIYN